MVSLSTHSLRSHWEARKWPGASVYCLVNRYFLLNPALSSSLPRRDSGSALASATKLLLLSSCRSACSHSQMSELFGQILNTEPRHLSDRFKGGESSYLLRFCEECLKHGYHADWFQCKAIFRCPIHGTSLQNRCPECGEPQLEPTLNHAARDPFACIKCSYSFTRSLEVRAAPSSLRDLDEFLERLPPLVIRPYTGARPIPFVRDRLNACSARDKQRYFAWTPSPVFFSFREERIKLDAALIDWLDDLHYIAVNNAFEFLLAACIAHVHEVAEVGTWLFLGRLREIDSPVSVVAAALCKTAMEFARISQLSWAACRVVQPGESSHSEGEGNFHPLAPPRGMQRHEMERPDYLEVLSLFSILLIEMARHPGQGINWRTQLDPSRYASAWSLFAVPGGGSEMRVRGRVNETVVQRLISRYAEVKVFLGRTHPDGSNS